METDHILNVVAIIALLWGALLLSGLIPALRGTRSPSNLKRTTARASKAGVLLTIVLVFYLVLTMPFMPSGPRIRTPLAQMKSDLRALLWAQEDYFQDSLRYFSGTASKAGDTSVEVHGYAPSAGVTVVIAATDGAGGSAAGFHATASHNASSIMCTVFLGSEAPTDPTAIEGRPDCALGDKPNLRERVECVARRGPWRCSGREIMERR